LADTAARPAPEDRYAAFRHMPFRRYWTQKFLNTLAVQIVNVAVAWQLYDMTREILLLGYLGLTQFLPQLVLVLVTGTAADLFGRRLIMAMAQLVEALAVLVLLGLTFAGLLTPFWIFTLLTGLGIARAFVGPASSSLIVSTVPQADFPNAVSWSTACWQTGTIIGPVFGGLLYGVSPELAYGMSALLLAIACGFSFAIPPPAERPKLGGGTLGMILGGFRYILSEKIVLGAISLDMFAVLLGGAVALLPVFARDILAVGPTGLGLLRAAPGIGAVLTAMWLTSHPIRDHAGLTMFAAVGFFGLFTTVFGFSTWAWLSILALALVGAADMFSVYVREILLQLWTPDHVRGRVNAVNNVFIGASNELGEFRAGLMGHWIGPVGAVVFGGLGSVAVAGAWAWMFPALRKTRSLDRGVEG
jgi:MFS family permease